VLPQGPPSDERSLAIARRPTSDRNDGSQRPSQVLPGLPTWSLLHPVGERLRLVQSIGTILWSLTQGAMQVAVISTAGSVLIQYIYTTYREPFVLTYICASLFILYLPWSYTCGRVDLSTIPTLGGREYAAFNETASSEGAGDALTLTKMAGT
jgi:hypothetical protein